MTGPRADVREVRVLVHELEHEAIGRLTASAGDESLCTLSRNGRARPAAKYHEGAAAALAQARRAVDGQAPDPAEAVRAVRTRWAAQAGPGTPSWHAYHEGGLDALDTLLGSPGHDVIGEDDGEAQAARGHTPGAGTTTTIGSGRGPTTLASRSGSRWSRRRTVVTAVLAPALLAALLPTGAGATPGEAPLWTALVALTALVSAVTLATYLPARGWRPDLGCSPCAAMSAASVLAAAWLLGSAPLQPSMALVALAAVTFGLVQRLTGAGATACRT